MIRVILLTVMLAGCQPKVLTKPVPVEVVKREYVRIDAALTKPIQLQDRADNTVRSYVLDAESCRRAVEAANARFGAIQQVSGKPSE